MRYRPRDRMAFHVGARDLKEPDIVKAKQAKELIDRCGSIRAAAKSSGIPRTTLQNRLKTFKEIKGTEIEVESLPQYDIPTPEIIELMCNRFKQRKKHADGAKWREFKVKTDKPIAICWFGDPHIDDNGCNWPLLREHCGIVAKTEGMYGANIGDTHNNWVGRLTKKYADQDTSVGTAYKLIEWLFSQSGVKWLLMLTGNHDSWNDDARLLKKLAENVCPMVDWRAQIKLVFKNGRECLIDAAHDHKGHSQWNALHGQQKASAMGGIAHIYIAGHRHNWALAQNECDQTGRVYHLARARGYKFMDEYAVTCGFGEQEHGAAIVTVIDPTADDLNFVRCFADVKEGAEYLTYLRSKK